MRPYMEPVTRFERVTTSLQRSCSTNWAIQAKSGGTSGARSHNLKIKSLLLYQLSYRPYNGGEYRTWTCKSITSTDFKSVALPIRLILPNVVGRKGLEPLRLLSNRFWVCRGYHYTIFPKSGGSCETWTRKPVRATDFKSAVYTIPPRSRTVCLPIL